MRTLQSCCCLDILDVHGRLRRRLLRHLPLHVHRCRMPAPATSPSPAPSPSRPRHHRQWQSQWVRQRSGIERSCPDDLDVAAGTTVTGRTPTPLTHTSTSGCHRVGLGRSVAPGGRFSFAFQTRNVSISLRDSPGNGRNGGRSLRCADVKFAKIVFPRRRRVGNRAWSRRCTFRSTPSAASDGSPITYPQFFYGFLSVTMAWQFAFPGYRIGPGAIPG